MEAKSGSPAARIAPRNGTRFRNPLAMPSGTAPGTLSAYNTATITPAINAPTIKLPTTNPRTILASIAVKFGTSTVSPNVCAVQSYRCDLRTNMKNVRNGTMPPTIRAPQTDPTPRIRYDGHAVDG